MKVAIIIVTLIAAHWMVGSVFCQALSPDQWLQAAGSDHSVLATQHSNTGWNRTVVGKSTEWPSTVARCNHTNGSSVQPSNWFRFTYRFAIQCAFVFFILLLVLLMCFYPDEPMFDISYSKYAPNVNHTEKGRQLNPCDAGTLSGLSTGNEEGVPFQEVVI